MESGSRRNEDDDESIPFEDTIEFHVSQDEGFEAGPRRSTYTPPPEGFRMPGAPEAIRPKPVVGDDELANALEAQIASLSVQYSPVPTSEREPAPSPEGAPAAESESSHDTADGNRTDTDTGTDAGAGADTGADTETDASSVRFRPRRNRPELTDDELRLREADAKYFRAHRAAQLAEHLGHVADTGPLPAAPPPAPASDASSAFAPRPPSTPDSADDELGNDELENNEFPEVTLERPKQSVAPGPKEPNDELYDLYRDLFADDPTGNRPEQSAPPALVPPSPLGFPPPSDPSFPGTSLELASDQTAADWTPPSQPTTPTSAFGGVVAVDTAGIAVVPTAEPEPALYVATSDLPAIVQASARTKAPLLEAGGLAPTPDDERAGRAVRLFWLWFAANASVISIGLGATVFALGVSLRQAMVAVLIGIALSFVPLGLGALASKRSGQPTMVLSRATFGFLGNAIPAVIAVLTRIFWGAVLLWLLSRSTAVILVTAGASAGLNERQVTVIVLAVAAILALVFSYFGFRLIARLQLVVSIASGILVAGLIAVTANQLDMRVALSVADGSWFRVVTGAVLVFSFVGLLWANSSGDIARYQRADSSSGATMAWATWGATLAPFVLLVWGAMLAASNPVLAAGLVTSPLDAIAGVLPAGYPVPLIAAVVLSLFSGVVLALYSGGFALQAVGVRIRRQTSVVIVAFGLALVAVVFTLFATGFEQVYRDIATTIAVPVAAWAGIFGAELMMRARRFDAGSLLARGGVYADVRWVNLGALVVISVIGFGFMSASVPWLSWQGYLYPLFGDGFGTEFAASDVGVVVALVLGVATPAIFSLRSIRAQETAAESAPKL